MELKNYLVNLLSNIIHDRLQMLSETKNGMKKTDDYKKVEDLFSDINNIINVDDDFLKDVLSGITDQETVDGIISNVDMIKIVLKGKSEGLDLDIDSSQEELVKGVYEIVNNYREELEAKNNETRDYLESFISKCQSLSAEIGTGVVRDIGTLDEIFSENNVPLEDIIRAKYDILRNNNKNYNTQLDDNVKEEVQLRIVFKDLDIDFDLFSDIEKRLLVECNIDSISEMVKFIIDNKLNISSDNLFMLLLLSNVSILSNILEICESYDFDINRLFGIPGVFVSKDVNVSNILDGNRNDNEFYVIERFQYIQPMYELFLDNITLLEANNRSVSDCFKYNMLSLIVPDLSKNITILSDLSLSNKDFSVVVINPFLATSRSGFEECGLSDYIKNNPLRLTTSYYRLKSISANIINARRNGQVIFRSLSDKKNYWLTKNITRGVK
ncbi:MAG: hypothetical protein ACI31V_02375 [Bacilli bacterium]